MLHTFCHRLGLVATFLLLLAPAQTARAQSKARARLLKYEWSGKGTSLGNSPIALKLKFTRKATRAALSVYWSRYQRFTTQGAVLKVSLLPKQKGLRIKDRFTDRHPVYKYKSSTGIYCHIPTRDFLRTHQFRCKLQYSGWILMHRKGVAPRSMTSLPPARPPSLKRNPTTPAPSPASSARRKPYVVGCWMKTVIVTRGRKTVRSLWLRSKGRYRWIQGRRRQKTSRGRYLVKGQHLLLLNTKRTRGTRWRFSVTRCIRRRPHQPCLQLSKPQRVRRNRRGKYVKRGRARTQSHLFFRVGTHPKCR